MRERILDYLLKAGNPQTSLQVLAAVLKTRSANLAGADAVVRGIIGDDPRFRFDDCRWTAATPSSPAVINGYRHAVALFIQKSDDPSGIAHFRVGLCKSDNAESLGIEVTASTEMPERENLGHWQEEARAQLMVTWSSPMVRLWGLLLRTFLIERISGPVLCIQRLASRTLVSAARDMGADSLAAAVGLPAPDSDRPADMARFYIDCLEPLLEKVPEDCRFPAAKLLGWIESGEPKVDFGRFSFGRDFLRRLPETPGVYIMRNRASDIIYVGKAGNLKRRVSSYFAPGSLKESKTERIHAELYSLDTVSTSSELDALLLETRMIRDFRPPVNFQMEIHEKAAGYGKWRNLVVLAPRPDTGKAKLYFLRDGIFEGFRCVPLGKPAPKSLRDKIRRTYFAAKGRRKRRRESWEMEIASRWLARNRRQINTIDMDDAGDYQSAENRLNWYLLDPDALSKKVIYR